MVPVVQQWMSHTEEAKKPKAVLSTSLNVLQSKFGHEGLEDSWRTAGLVSVGIQKKLVLILVKECLSDRIDELGSECEGKQAKAVPLSE
ncbi:hypothetical protein STEG23_032815, partial [Scotinomys teguina]